MTIYDDEIDLRPIILAILQRWWIILLAAVILAIAAFAYSEARSKVYEAKATILLARSRATLNIADQFPTINEPVDARSRMDALMSIAESDELVVKIIQALGEKIPPRYREVNALKGLVELTNQGDIITVKAITGDPAQAAEIANAWAQQAVDAINLAYSGEQPLAEIQNQLQTSKQEYETAQSELENFIQNNKINILEQQVAEIQTLFSRLSGDRSWKISYYMDRKQRMEDLQVQAEALKLQLQDGSQSQAGSLGDALAALRARADALGIIQGNIPDQVEQSTTTSGNVESSSPQNFIQEPQSSITLNLQLGDIQSITDNPANYMADLTALVDLAEQEITRSEEALKSLEQDITDGSGYESIQTVASQLGNLQTQLEAERAHERELTSQRDLTWQAYQAMAEKDTELRNATQTNNQVVLASRAVPPETPLANETVRNTVIAGVLGTILGTAVVLAVYWWRSIDLNSRATKPSLSSDPSNR